MTREQAIKIWKETFAGEERHWGEWELQKVVEADVDAFAALGMLKLDEPKSVDQRAREIMNPMVGVTYADAVLNELAVAGFKIVEK